MKKNNLEPVTATLGAGVILTLTGAANAADHPFQMVEFGPAVMLAEDAVDRQGNKIKIDDGTILARMLARDVILGSASA